MNSFKNLNERALLFNLNFFKFIGHKSISVGNNKSKS